jgi:N-acetylneuraminic acid mutarotase
MKRITSKTLLVLAFLVVTYTAYAQDWQSIETTNTCTKRHENAVAAVKGKVIVLGGRGDRPVESFDPRTRTWTKLADAPMELHHFQAVTYNDEVWVLGAFTGGYPHETPVPDIHIFNPATKEWRKGPAIPEDRRRGAAGVFVYKNKIYMVCGIQDGHWDGHVAWLDEYDPRTDTWKKLPDAPHARDHVQAVVINDKIWVAGGRKSTARTGRVIDPTLEEVDVFDFKTQTWTTLPASQNIPTRRAGNATVAFGSKVLVIGGESGSQVAAHSEVEAFDTKSGKWEALPSLKQGRHGTGAVIINGKIYIAAGSGNRGGGPELNDIEVWSGK